MDFQLRKFVRSLEFDSNAFEDLEWWVKQDRKKVLKIFKLIKDIEKTPFKGLGKPEPLKESFAGSWSRRIDEEHRLIYQVLDNKVRILACRYHYDEKK
ncbi:MAG: putative addiction module toxin, Txe/YoeB [Ignavibacteria bacterium]|nr:putative addiction module toxin, Txe/YoeB [Ignavibacteria bacterium]